MAHQGPHLQYLLARSAEVTGAFRRAFLLIREREAPPGMCGRTPGEADVSPRGGA